MSTSPQQLTAAGLWVASVETGRLVSDPWLSRWGVSLHYHPELTAADITGMTQDRAAGILSSQGYWPRPWNALPAFLAKPVLAFSVLEGPTKSARALQAALGVKTDGDIGAGTVAAAEAGEAKALDPVDGVLRRLVEAQADILKESPRWLIDGVGWVGRCSAGAVAGAVDLMAGRAA